VREGRHLYLMKGFDDVSARLLETRLAYLEGAVGQVVERLNGIDRRLDTLEHVVQSRFSQLEQLIEARFGANDARFTSIDQRFVQIDQRFAMIDQRFVMIDQRFNWLIGIVIGTWIITILTILFHH
jgi:tetrahydromethanopterin S-methyltransferase subunit G